MSPPAAPFPLLSSETARLARAVYQRDHLYLRIGDRLDLLCADVSWSALGSLAGGDVRSLFIMAMLTLFQYAEDVPDRQAADALRIRLDWKYALHLPSDYPGLEPTRLAEFRSQVAGHEAGRQMLGCLLARLAAAGLLGSDSKGEADVARVLATVTALNELERAQAALRLAVEALAASEPDWLRQVGLPHWHLRYGGAHSAATSWRESDLSAQLEALGHDIAHLLSVVSDAGREDLLRWPEIQVLRSIAAQWPSPSDGQARRWRLGVLASDD